MKRKDFYKLSSVERAAVSELVASGNVGSLVGVRKSDKKPDSELPLFASKDVQTKLF